MYLAMMGFVPSYYDLGMYPCPCSGCNYSFTQVSSIQWNVSTKQCFIPFLSDIWVISRVCLFLIFTKCAAAKILTLRPSAHVAHFLWGTSGKGGSWDYSGDNAQFPTQIH